MRRIAPMLADKLTVLRSQVHKAKREALKLQEVEALEEARLVGLAHKEDMRVRGGCEGVAIGVIVLVWGDCAVVLCCRSC